MDIIAIVITSVIGLWLGSIEYRLRHMDQELDKRPSRKEVNRSLDRLDRDIREGLKRVETKLDMLLNLYIKKNDD